MECVTARTIRMLSRRQKKVLWKIIKVAQNILGCYLLPSLEDKAPSDPPPHYYSLRPHTLQTLVAPWGGGAGIDFFLHQHKFRMSGFVSQQRGDHERTSPQKNTPIIPNQYSFPRLLLRQTDEMKHLRRIKSNDSFRSQSHVSAYGRPFFTFSIKASLQTEIFFFFDCLGDR